MSHPRRYRGPGYPRRPLRGWHRYVFIRDVHDGMRVYRDGVVIRSREVQR